MSTHRSPATPHPVAPFVLSLALVVLGVVLGATVPAPALAQATPDAPVPSEAAAPTLSVRTDAATPYYAVAVTVDPVAMFLGEWGARLDVALDWVNAFYVEPHYLGGDVQGLGSKLGYRLFPLADGLEGPFAGLAAGVALVTPDAPRASIWGGVDLGWQLVWSGVVLSASGGVGWVEPLGDDGATNGASVGGISVGSGVVVRASVAIGYAFM